MGPYPAINSTWQKGWQLWPWVPSHYRSLYVNTKEVAVPELANTKPAAFSHLRGDQTELLEVQLRKASVPTSACETLGQGPYAPRAFGSPPLLGQVIRKRRRDLADLLAHLPAAVFPHRELRRYFTILEFACLSFPSPPTGFVLF